MKTVLLILIGIFYLNNSFSQKVDYSLDWINDFEIDTSLRKDLKFSEFLKIIDLSKSFKYIDIGDSAYPWEDYGIFDENNLRIDIVFTSVKKNENNPLQYDIKGKTRLKSNICDFSGYVLLTQIKKYYNNYAYSGDLIDTTFFGRVLGNYEFKENENQFGTGVFNGAFSANIDIDFKHPKESGFRGEFELSKYQGSYVGTWQDYKTQKNKKCIWTVGSIDFPYSGDFWIPLTKVEIAEHKKHQGCKCNIYSPNTKINTKYINNGWKSYLDKYLEKREQWWIEK